MSSRIVPLVCATVTIALLLAFMHRDYPAVGLDFGQFVPRLIDAELHIRQNGMVPQWYTPSFGSGLPAFANPQHLQYSLIQLLFLVTGAWSAVLLSTAAVSAIGFGACYVFLNRTLDLSVIASTLGAMSVVANGFNIQHISGGHVGFQLFPLLPVFLLAATGTRFSIRTASVVCGLSAAAIVHNGGAQIAVLIGGSTILALQVTHLLSPAVVNWRRVMTIAALSSVIAVSLSASKIYAVAAFMSHYPRELADRYPIDTAHGLFGLGSQLAGGMMIIPILYASRFPTQRLDDALVNATGSGVHVTELDVSVQPILMIAMAIAVARMLWLLWQRRLNWQSVAPQWLAWCLLVVTAWIAVETTLARGWIYPSVHALPIFRSMHVNHRVAGVFIMPITVAAACAINSWRPHRRPVIGAVLLASALLFQASYALLPELFYRRWFDMTKIEQIQQRVRAGERFPVDRVDEILEEDVFAGHTSSRIPYEPLFGYDNEQFKAETTNGPVNAIRDGRFNLTNPASLDYPELNGLKPFERIHEDDAENLRRFLNREQPQWRHPAVLDWLNRLAVVTLGLCILVLAHATLTSRQSPPHHANCD